VRQSARRRQRRRPNRHRPSPRLRVTLTPGGITSRIALFAATGRCGHLRCRDRGRRSPRPFRPLRRRHPFRRKKHKFRFTTDLAIDLPARANRHSTNSATELGKSRAKSTAPERVIEALAQTAACSARMGIYSRCQRIQTRTPIRSKSAKSIAIFSSVPIPTPENRSRRAAPGVTFAEWIRL